MALTTSAWGITACGRGQAEGTRTATRTGTSGRLRLRPPRLERPRTIRLTHDSLEEHGEVNLYGEGQDWVIELPRDRPITKGISIHGRDEARNVVIVGGAIEPARRFDPTTMRLADGSWAVAAERGFAGATGGTFRIRSSERGPFTTPLPFDATPDRIRAALEAVAGAGSVFAVDGPATPGGPWSIVPADVRLGRVVLDLSGLQGAPKAVAGANVFAPYSGGLKLKQWRGTLHLEGVAIGGADCSEGIDVQNPWGTAIAQFANLRIDVRAYSFHKDWQHPDAMQCYLGPAELRMERCELLCRGAQSFLGQPRQTTAPRALESLRDWWFEDVLFQTRLHPAHRGEDPGATCYMEDDWPSNNFNDAGWEWHMRRCYASRLDIGGREVGGQSLGYFNHYGHPAPAGLHIAARPPRALVARSGRRAPGLRYRSPGYGGARVARGTARLAGQTKLT